MWQEYSSVTEFLHYEDTGSYVLTYRILGLISGTVKNVPFVWIYLYVSRKKTMKHCVQMIYVMLEEQRNRLCSLETGRRKLIFDMLYYYLENLKTQGYVKSNRVLLFSDPLFI